ncbi:hypothetical protein O1M63_01760 [Streptomyces mirabilis]|nr:hypothetical protein [Streptomyces mirabilis]
MRGVGGGQRVGRQAPEILGEVVVRRGPVRLQTQRRQFLGGGCGPRWGWA